MSKSDGKAIAKKLIETNRLMMDWSKESMKLAFSEEKNQNLFASGNITIRQLQMIHIIRDDGINTISGIAKELNLSKSSTSLTISKLVKNGLLEKRSPDEDDDGRKAYFFLTQEGETEAARMESDLVEMIGRAFRDLSQEDTKKICDHLDAIISLLNRRFKV